MENILGYQLLGKVLVLSSEKSAEGEAIEKETSQFTWKQSECQLNELHMKMIKL